MRKQRRDTMPRTPVFPVIPELFTVISKNLLRPTLQLVQHLRHVFRRWVRVKLLRHRKKPAVVVDAHKKPVPVALNCKWTLKVQLPELIRLLSSKEFPALKLPHVTVLVVACENLVYGFS